MYLGSVVLLQVGTAWFYLFLNKSLFFCACSSLQAFDNTVGKEEIALNDQFSFFHSVFNPFGDLPAIFIKLEIVA